MLIKSPKTDWKALALGVKSVKENYIVICKYLKSFDIVLSLNVCKSIFQAYFISRAKYVAHDLMYNINKGIV